MNHMRLMSVLLFLGKKNLPFSYTYHQQNMKTITCYLFSGLFLLFALSCSNETPESVNGEARPGDHPTLADEAGEEVPVVPPSMAGPGYQVGDMVQNDFKLKNVDGNMVSLADYPDAKGYVIIFTCNHCPYSIAYEDRIISLDKKYKAMGYPVIAINPNDPEIVEEDSYEAMIVRAKKKGFTFPYLFDADQSVYPEYGATKTPHVYVLTKTPEGNKVAYTGAIDDSKEMDGVSEMYLSDALESIVKGEEPTMAQTKAFGCSIKDKNDPYKDFEEGGKGKKNTDLPNHSYTR